MTELTIIAIHGNGGGGFRFERILPFIPAHVQFDAIILSGFAGVPADASLKTLGDYATKIHDIVQASESPVILLGTGIGGSMILEYVQHYASHVAGIILHAPVGTRLDSRRFPWLMSLPGMKALGQYVFSSPITRPIFKRLLFADHTQIPENYLNRFFDEYRRSEAFGQMFDIITANWYDNLQPSSIPTALLWGERERVLSMDHVADYQELLPDNIVRIIPDWDHFPMIEQPEEYAKEVIDLAENLLKKTDVND